MLITICVTTCYHIPQDSSFYAFKLHRVFFFIIITGAKTESTTRENMNTHTQKRHDTTISEKFRLRLMFNLKIVE